MAACTNDRAALSSAMPELAEVEFYRRRWSVGHGAKIQRVLLHPSARVFRDCDVAALTRRLAGATLRDSAAAAKQMLFRFSGDTWLGIHLGMSGELFVAAPDYLPRQSDHLVLVQAERALVFRDPRMFGAVRLHPGRTEPAWWTTIAPALSSPAFNVAAVAAFLARRGRAPLKAVLLMQERFPGVGNWMADEILWRARLVPQRLAGKLTAAEVRRLHRECRRVAANALRVIAGTGGRLPPDLNAHIPDTWLFNYRWRPGAACPRCDAPLRHATVGGRTSCWCPRCQPS
jgi:formamidopyrimidine-DNA glycosylase